MSIQKCHFFDLTFQKGKEKEKLKRNERINRRARTQYPQTSNFPTSENRKVEVANEKIKNLYSALTKIDRINWNNEFKLALFKRIILILQLKEMHCMYYLVVSLLLFHDGWVDNPMPKNCYIKIVTVCNTFTHTHILCFTSCHQNSSSTNSTQYTRSELCNWYVIVLLTTLRTLKNSSWESFVLSFFVLFFLSLFLCFVFRSIFTCYLTIHPHSTCNFINLKIYQPAIKIKDHQCREK